MEEEERYIVGQPLFQLSQEFLLSVVKANLSMYSLNPGSDICTS